MKHKLTSLSEWNEARQKHHAELEIRLSKTGLACNSCGEELRYADTITITSSPPRRNVRCFGCGFIGTKIV